MYLRRPEEFEAVSLNASGPEKGTAAKIGGAKWENGRLQADTSARAERRKGTGPCCWAERGRGDPFGSSELLDQPRCHLNPCVNVSYPCSFTWLHYACPEVFRYYFAQCFCFLERHHSVYPRKVHSLPTKIWHIYTCLSQELSVSKNGNLT